MSPLPRTKVPVVPSLRSAETAAQKNARVHFKRRSFKNAKNGQTRKSNPSWCARKRTKGNPAAPALVLTALNRDQRKWEGGGMVRGREEWREEPLKRDR